MRKILKIARVELSILFCSPIAWLVLIIFCIQCGLSFTGLLAEKEASQQLGHALSALTANIFTGKFGFLTAVQNKLFLYIPLLTMGLMSREISSGSIKLLLSSPVTNTQIILGKFVSMMAYGLLLMLVLGLTLAMGAYAIEALDVKLVLGGILGLYLLVCAYAAIGIFLSSLTAYQVVAAISTLAVLAALKFVGQIGQSMDFVREITYWISIDGRVDNFISGIISSKDVVYFLLVILLFLSLTIMRLDAGRVIRSATVKNMRYAVLIVSVLLIGYVSSLPAFTGYFDTTRFKDRTLTKESQELIKHIKKPVTLTSYVNILNAYAHVGAPKFRIFERNQFEQFLRYLPDLKITYVPYYDTTMTRRQPTEMSLEESAQRAAMAHGFDFTEVLSPAEIKKVIDLVPEENRFVRMMTYDGKSTPLRMFSDMYVYPHEAEISAGLKRLLFGPAVIGVLSGNGERDIYKTGDKDYQALTTAVSARHALINQGFDIKEIQLDSIAKIPELTVLVIADPMVAYSSGQMEKIKQYMERGGNALIAGEPRKQALLNPLIEPLGVSFGEGMLFQKSNDYAPDLIQAKPSKHAQNLDITIRDKKPIVSMPTAVALMQNDKAGYTSTPLLVSDAQVQSKSTLGVALTRKTNARTQKIAIIGDADFMSNGELGRRNLSTVNNTFAVQLFRWFSDGAYPIDANRPDPIDNRIVVGKDIIGGMKATLAGVLPLLLALAGGLLQVGRKRR